MPRLVTPVLYEDSLDELNMVRPLSITDKVGVGIDIPVLDSLSAASGKSIVGRLLRSDEGGCSLVGSLEKQTGFERIDVLILYMTPLVVFVFAQPCNYFDVTVVAGYTGDSLKWVDATGIQTIQDLSLTDVNTILVYGDTLVLKGAGLAGWGIGVNVRGFY